MSHCRIGAIALFACIAYTQHALAQTPDEATMKQQASGCHTQGWTRSGVSTEYDVKFYRLHLHVSPDKPEIIGTVTVGFEAGTAGMGQMELDASNALTVDSVLHRGARVQHSHTGQNLCVFSLSQTLLPGQFDSVQVHYHGLPGSSSFRSSLQAHGPVLWTLSQPNGAKDWWPCKNLLTDKADSLDVLITCPARYTAVSNGLLAGWWQTDTFSTWHWKHRYPVAAYLVAIAVSHYSHYTEYARTLSGDSFPIENFVYPPDSAVAVAGTAALIPALAYYQTLFGNYPFAAEKYGHAQFSRGGGMEHQTITFVNSFGIELLTHELAHHWFGNMVTCNSWQHIWLNEGFATYLTGLYYEKFKTPADFLAWKGNAINHIMSQEGGSVFCPDTLQSGRIFDGRLTYTKGAMLVHLLRVLCGDTAFFTGVKNYLNARQHSFAATADLVQHLQAASGKNLVPVLSQWFYGEGYPSYTLLWQTLPQQQVRVEIAQKTSSSLVSWFGVPVPLQFCDASQCSTVWLQPAFNHQIFEFSLPFVPDTVVFNPGYDIIARADITRLGGSIGGVLAFPNPCGGNVRISMVDGRQFTHIQLVEAGGKTVLSHKAESPQGMLTLDIRALPEGVYVAIATLADGSQARLRVAKAE